MSGDEFQYHYDGTSDATAYVSAAAALVRAKYPNLSPGQIANRLTKTAGLPDSLQNETRPDDQYGYGYIQPLPALTKDIPTGSKYGPLKVPASLKNPDPAPTAVTSDSSSSKHSVKRLVVFGGLGVVILVIVGGVVLVSVRAARRN